MARQLFRLYVDIELDTQKIISVSHKQAHYLRHVLRLKLDDFLLLFNGKQGEWQAQIYHITKHEVTLCVQHMTRPMTQTFSLNLYFAPLKSGPLSFLLEKATELGATNLYPIWFSRVQGRDFKADRYSLIIQEAAEQCERLDLPILHTPLSLEALLLTWSQQKILFVCDERRNAVPLWDILCNQKLYDNSAHMMIGPEGGFTPQEFNSLSQCLAVKFVSLGSTILRAETAGLSALSVLTNQLYSYQRKTL